MFTPDKTRKLDAVLVGGTVIGGGDGNAVFQHILIGAKLGERIAAVIGQFDVENASSLWCADMGDGHSLDFINRFIQHLAQLGRAVMAV